VNEFGAEFDGAFTSWIDVGKHAPANAIAGFQDLDSKTGVAQLARCGQSRHAGADDDHRRM
jgi:hypothetical protein